MLSVAFSYCSTECYNVKHRFAECRGASVWDTDSAKFPRQAKVIINITEFLV
jgi:hypothetical protein